MAAALCGSRCIISLPDLFARSASPGHSQLLCDFQNILNMADNAQKLAMVNQLVDHTNQALQNPGDEKQKSKLLSSTIVVALNSATSVLQQVGALDDRVQVVEAAVADKITRDEAQRMMERFASEAQKAQVNLPPLPRCESPPCCRRLTASIASCLCGG